MGGQGRSAKFFEHPGSALWRANSQESAGGVIASNGIFEGRHPL